MLPYRLANEALRSTGKIYLFSLLILSNARRKYNYISISAINASEDLVYQMVILKLKKLRSGIIYYEDPNDLKTEFKKIVILGDLYTRNKELSSAKSNRYGFRDPETDGVLSTII